MHHFETKKFFYFTEAEIPEIKSLKRDRELGDLRSLEIEPFLRIELGSVVLVNHRIKLVRFFRDQGCPCKDDLLENRCAFKAPAIRKLFTHLAQFEKKNGRFVVFKGKFSNLTYKKGPFIRIISPF